ncbi:alpha/beta hydrolase [Streptomyces sp. SA15]|uniref:alpha/beta fold hydrolase n=1 Tax=Streptomyces sp. SA15 TaxID=934019 RepID=UPI00211BAB5F|nr:alpha/beta hydrolase [Streptomyces sp. SA15]
MKSPQRLEVPSVFIRFSPIGHFGFGGGVLPDRVAEPDPEEHSQHYGGPGAPASGVGRTPFFAADVPAPVTKVLAAAQRPLAAAVFEETATAAAWQTKPSWALVAGADRAINPEVQRFGAKRAGATIVELEGPSHAVAVSQPKKVADVIRDAVRATR